MELKIKPYHKNLYSLEGILIKHVSVMFWLKEVCRLNLDLSACKLYAVPGETPNSIWGCFIISNKKIPSTDLGRNEICQKVTENVYIPERCILYPPLNKEELNSYFKNTIHLFHPEFGLLELMEEVDLRALIEEPVMKSYYLAIPEESVFIPHEIKSFQVIPLEKEELLKNLDEKVFPKKEEMKDESLSLIEKAKLGAYRLLFKMGESGGAKSIEKTGLLALFESVFKNSFLDQKDLLNKMQEDFDDLENRNKSQMDKLMDMFKNNPEEALKYAIPIDNTQSARGNNNGQLALLKRWNNFSLFERSSATGSGTVNIGENLQLLQNQYRETAKRMEEEKQFHKAAFIYMKLLKEYYNAAFTLEKGHFYQEAAIIYLNHCNNSLKAAECYEKGKMTEEALAIYKELRQYEKVGDLYMKLQKRKEANMYYEKLVDEYKSKNQFVKASLVYKNKMQDPQGGQNLLLEGFRANLDAVNCLGNYFTNIKEVKQLKREIEYVYTNDVNEKNCEMFLEVLKHEHKKRHELADDIKELAYEIIAQQIPVKPSIVTELKEFNRRDTELLKDALRFKLTHKR